MTLKSFGTTAGTGGYRSFVGFDKTKRNSRGYGDEFTLSISGES